MRTACDTVRLLVCDGYNVTDETQEPAVSIKTSLSSSSIDREDEMTNVFRQVCIQFFTKFPMLPQSYFFLLLNCKIFILTTKLSKF